MSDAEALLAIVAAVYAFDCAQRVPLDSVLLSAPWARRFRVQFPSFELGHVEGALVWGNPLPPLGPVLLTQENIPAISPDGALAYSAWAANPTLTPSHSERFVAWDDDVCVGLQDCTVLVGGAPFFLACSATSAAQWARLLRRVAESPRGERAALIDRALARRINGLSIARRRHSLAMRTQGLRIACNALWIELFLGGALLAWWTPMLRSWAPLLLGLIFLMGAVLYLFRRAYCRLYRLQRTRWRRHAAMMLFSPMEAIRAYDIVSRDALSVYDPLAAAAAMCPRDEVVRLARQVVCNRAHPLPRKLPLPERARETWLWFANRCEALLDRQLAELGLRRDALLEPPEPIGEDCRSYCPRCETQFLVKTGTCRACGDLPLVQMGPSCATDVE